MMKTSLSILFTLCIATTLLANDLSDVPKPLYTNNRRYYQNFDSLIGAGEELPFVQGETLTGWWSNQHTYRVGNGSSNIGSLYSFGISNKNRALGSIPSNKKKTIVFGVSLLNTNKDQISYVDFEFWGEQWRWGGEEKRHRLHLDWVVLSNTSYYNGGWAEAVSGQEDNWVYQPRLSFSSRDVKKEEEPGPMNGHDPANRKLMRERVPLVWPKNHVLLIRWLHRESEGQDDALAIDDFALDMRTLKEEKKDAAAFWEYVSFGLIAGMVFLVLLTIFGVLYVIFDLRRSRHRYHRLRSDDYDNRIPVEVNPQSL